MTAHLSWPRLEAYCLGELDEAQYATVEDHVRGCLQCRRMLSTIEADADPMPPLPVPATPWRWRWAVAAAAAAAVLVVWLVPRNPGGAPEEGSVKGGDPVMMLVRDRGGAVQLDPEGYLSGDRFTVLVTCDEGERGYRLEVSEGEDGPHVVGEGIASCGNQVQIGEGLRLTGALPMEVCLVLEADEADSEHRLCRRLRALDR